jgi:hypothetical protein
MLGKCFTRTLRYCATSLAVMLPRE